MTPRLRTETQATFLCQDPLCAESPGGGGGRVLRRRGLRLRLRAINHWAGRSLGQHPWAIQRVGTVSARRRESGKEKSEDGEKLMKTSVLFRKLGLCQKKKITSNDFIAWFSTPASLEKQAGLERERLYKPVIRFPSWYFRVLPLGGTK